MTEQIYHQLQRKLNQMPIGYPATESGIEIRILKRLFSPAEAEITVQLSPFPELVADIASRTGKPVAELEPQLDAMSRNGLIFRLKRDGQTRYNLAPFMIGMYEYSVEKIDAEMAAMFAEYFETAFLTELGISNIPGFKVIPIEEHIQPDQELLPHHKLEEKIRAARKISVADCICRKESRLAGHGCDYPLETCLNFGVAAEYYIENGIGREIDAEEAIRILNMADAAGLVHAGANSKHLSNICNCCPCCCASMKGITQKGHDTRKYMNALYEAVIDLAECTECEACMEACPVSAISNADPMVVDRSRCLGCGVCAGICPVEGISLVLRPDREEPFERVSDMGMAILEAKKKLQDTL
ncbi:MAG: 4Fe-4S binding protein [bacterium]